MSEDSPEDREVMRRDFEREIYKRADQEEAMSDTPYDKLVYHQSVEDLLEKVRRLETDRARLIEALRPFANTVSPSEATQRARALLKELEKP